MDLHNTWGQNSTEGSVTTITCPSGSQAEVKRLGMQGLIATGVMGEADTLVGVVDTKHVRRVRGGNGKPDRDEVDPKSLMQDPANLARVIMLVDRAAPHIVVNPVVRLHFVDLDNVDDGMPRTRRLSDDERAHVVEQHGQCVWTDQMPFEDKMHIFNWAVGGTADATRFPGESEVSVGTVDNVPRLANKAKRPRGHKR